MTPRSYQTDAIDSTMDRLREHDSTLIVAATGTGKTVIAGEIIKRFLYRGRIMFIADREELLAQASEKIQTLTGLRPDLEMADSRACNGMFKSPIVVSSIQTQRSGTNGNRRWNRFDPNEFSLLFVDEADLAAADSYRAMIDHYRQNPRLKLVGCTATPDRHDEKALGEIFESVAFEFGIVDAIKEGWLVPITQKYLSVEVNLGGIGYTLGDFNGKELREKLAEGDTLDRIASDSIQYAGDRRTLVFSDSVQNAETLTTAYNRWRIGCARIVTGETDKDERRQLIADYRAGRFQYLVNVGVASRGFDVPEVACIVAARPTCSRSLYQQQIGRGTRPLGGVVDGLGNSAARITAIANSSKANLLVLDVVGNSSKHKLVTATDILGGNYSEEIVELAEREMKQSGVPCDVAESLERAQQKRNAELQAEAARLERLRLRPKSKSRDVDPFEVFHLVRRERRGWEPDRKATPEQVAKLAKWRMDKAIAEPTFAEAEQLIGEVRSRARRGLCTYRMAQLLNKHGHDSTNMPFAQASKLIDEISARWKR